MVPFVVVSVSGPGSELYYNGGLRCVDVKKFTLLRKCMETPVMESRVSWEEIRVYPSGWKAVSTASHTVL